MSDGKYRLGLDLGTNSLGWAAVKIDDSGSPCGILDMGVRIFPDGRNPTDKTSLALKRRIPRGARRRRDRYLKRRSELMDALIALGLMPEDQAARKGLERLDPYVLRARALDGPLKPFELGRALFHLDQRRGFKSNRRADAADESESKKTRARINELRSRIQESGARTLGEFLARRHAKEEPVRARPGVGLYPDRALYEAEFDAIRAAQQPHHALTPQQWDCLKDTVFFQRKLKPVKPGWCLFEPGEKRSPRALPVAQEFRLLQELANLRLQAGLEPERPLTHDERTRALQRLRSGRDINLKKPTRDLGLPSDAVFNLARGIRTTVKGDETTARLKKDGLFGERWLSLSLEERSKIVGFLLETDDPEIVHRKATAEWGLTDAQAAAVAEVTLPAGYANLSVKAIRRIIPFMEGQRLGYAEAVVAAGYPHHSDFRNPEAHERLPYYGTVLERQVVGADPDAPESDEPARYGRIANPTVHIGLNQLRRVANRLSERYGKPERIVVELARDLKLNREQRQEVQNRQRQGRERNLRFTEMIESAELQVTPEALRKLRLWEEQGPAQARVCPYSGTQLSFDMVMSAATEIDHILPVSQTLDDSVANQVVCIAAANRDKGNRSPHEAFGHSPPGYNYEEILRRVQGFPPVFGYKRWRFEENAMERYEGKRDFLDRQLNETRYLSRVSREYLAYLYDEKTEGRRRVDATPGVLTAALRTGWGLNSLLRETAPSSEDAAEPKLRDDHRHHAIDAFVVAITTPSLLHAVSAAAARFGDEAVRSLAKHAQPWSGFSREDLRPFLERMVVSYKPDHGTRGDGGKTTGQLHNETAYGLVGNKPLDEKGTWKVVVRKPLDSFKKRAGLKAVRDPALRDALMALWDRVAASGAKPAEFATVAATEGVPLNGRTAKVRRVRVLDEARVVAICDRKGCPYKGYLPDANEFADIWRLPDGKWKTVVVRTFEANQPGFDPARYRPHPAAKRLMRLHINDMGAIGTGPHRRIVRVRKITAASSGVFVVLDDHNEANVPARVGKDMRENRYTAPQLKTSNFRRAGVDEIGRVIDPGPHA